MRKFGLIGKDLSHSFSKDHFEQKFKKEGIPDATYELFPLNTIEELPELLRQEPELRGLNVTIPFKSQIFPYLDRLHPEAEEVGAVNTITISEDGLDGNNTDVHGFRSTFEPLLRTSDTSALILGTGGGSKAVAFVLRQLGIDHGLVSRRPSGPDQIHYSEVTEEMIAKTSILINTTPLGKWPDVDQCPDIPYKALTEDHLLYDLIYNPKETLFLKRGKDHGARVENGSDMLIAQAEASWRIWNKEQG